MNTQLPSPSGEGLTSLSYSGERQVLFTANIPLQMLNREIIWPLHFCYRSMKAIPGRTAQANEREKQFSSR